MDFGGQMGNFWGLKSVAVTDGDGSQMLRGRMGTETMSDGDGYNFCGNGWGWLDFPLPCRSLLWIRLFLSIFCSSDVTKGQQRWVNWMSRRHLSLSDGWRRLTQSTYHLCWPLVTSQLKNTWKRQIDREKIVPPKLPLFTISCLLMTLQQTSSNADIYSHSCVNGDNPSCNRNSTEKH